MIVEKVQIAPRARKEQLITQELADELLVYDLERHKAHCLNQTAALVWQNCDGQTSIKQLAAMLKTDAQSQEDKELMIKVALGQLGKADLLEEKLPEMGLGSGLSRRAVMKRIGLAAAASLPLVTSLVAPEAIQAVTQACATIGQTCGRGAPDCCAGLTCIGGICVLA